MKFLKFGKHKKKIAKPLVLFLAIFLFLSSLVLLQLLAFNQVPAGSTTSANIRKPNNHVLGAEVAQYNPAKIKTKKSLKCTKGAEISRVCTGYYKADATYLKTNCKTYTESITDNKCGAPANYQPKWDGLAALRNYLREQCKTDPLICDSKYLKD